MRRGGFADLPSPSRGCWLRLLPGSCCPRRAAAAAGGLPVQTSSLTPLRAGAPPCLEVTRGSEWFPSWKTPAGQRLGSGARPAGGLAPRAQAQRVGCVDRGDRLDSARLGPQAPSRSHAASHVSFSFSVFAKPRCSQSSGEEQPPRFGSVASPVGLLLSPCNTSRKFSFFYI